MSLDMMISLSEKQNLLRDMASGTAMGGAPRQCKNGGDGYPEDFL